MRIETRSLASLKPAPYNPRVNLKPGDLEYEKLKRSVATYGLVEPIIVNQRTGLIVGGHQRAKVAQDLGILEAPCVIVDLDDKNERALNVALNRISGSWSIPSLKELLVGLDDGAFDLTLTGFNEDDLKNLIDYDKAPSDGDGTGAGEVCGECGRKLPRKDEADA